MGNEMEKNKAHDLQVEMEWIISLACSHVGRRALPEIAAFGARPETLTLANLISPNGIGDTDSATAILEFLTRELPGYKNSIWRAFFNEAMDYDRTKLLIADVKLTAEAHSIAVFKRNRKADTQGERNAEVVAQLRSEIGDLERRLLGMIR